MLERSAGKLARSVLRGEGSRKAPDLPGGNLSTVFRCKQEKMPKKQEELCK